jgi:hypothetical protein
MIVERLVADLSTIRYVLGSQRCCMPYQRTCESHRWPKTNRQRETGGNDEEEKGDNRERERERERDAQR